MVGYDPAKDKVKGKGKMGKPYDLTGEDDYATSSESSAAVQLAAPSSAPASTLGSSKSAKRSHATMTASGSGGLNNGGGTSNALKVFGTTGKKGSYTILIPKLTIRMFPSGYQSHYLSSPVNGRGALTKKLGEWEEKRMVDAGRKVEKKVRGPNKARKKRMRKTGERVGREDLAEDERDEEEVEDAGPSTK